jgi:hypothetical protein
MKVAVIAMLVLASLLPGAERERKRSESPDLEIIRASARHVENRIELEGVVRNVSEQPIEGAILRLDFLSSGEKVISMKKGPLPDEVLEPGDESAFYFQMPDEPRAVSFRVKAVNGKGHELRVTKPGPYWID